MGIQEFDPSKYELDYVPQRLTSLEVCVMACHAMLSDKVASTPLRIDLGASKLEYLDLSVFVNLAIDAGLVANRTLMNFVGLKLQEGGLVNDASGLNVTKFGLPLTSPAAAQTILMPSIPEAEMRRIWLEALSTASKSIAHFTEKGAIILAARLGYACFATAELVRRDFYAALGKPAPITLLRADVLPRHGTVWDSVDPRLNVRC
jgi:hypothetical protein